MESKKLVKNRRNRRDKEKSLQNSDSNFYIYTNSLNEDSVKISCNNYDCSNCLSSSLSLPQSLV